MFDLHDLQRVQTIIEKINLILEIVSESGGIVAALSDTKLKHLIMRGLIFRLLKWSSVKNFRILNHVHYKYSLNIHDSKEI